MATLTKGTTFTSGDVVTPAKLNNLVDQATLSPIVTADIADSQITTAKIADANVTTAKIADANVTTAKIADANVTTAKITDANVTTAKIADGAVTAEKLAPGAIPSSIPAGAIMPFAMNSAPSGWLAADGTAISRSAYATLFAAIGSTHGVGDGSTTFNLPDLRGIFVRGSGSQTISTKSYNATFAAKQNDALISHTHNLSTGVGSTANPSYAGYTTGSATQKENTSLPASPNSTETRPANIALLYCIKF